jgi:chromate transporter
MVHGPEADAMNGELRQVATLFLKLGFIGFGGPAAHIAMMEDEVVRRRKWMTHERFLDLIGATNLIPGPNSTEMTMHCGHERAGWRGLIVAGVCFITPAVLLTGLLAWAYQRYGQLPAVKPFIYGIQPAVIAIILGAVYTLARKAIKSAWLGVLAVAALVACLAGVSELLALFACGAVGIAVALSRGGQLNSLLPLTALGSSAPLASLSTGGIFWTFLKIGSILYGSGYVLFAFLEDELVTTGLLSVQALNDAIAVGQFTPGPVFSSATFIGFQMNGWPGAIAATVGIFLPSFLFVALLNPIIPKLRASTAMSGFLDAVNAASVAVILAVCVTMVQATVTDWRAITIGLLSLLVTFGWKRLNSAWIVLGGALLGYLLHLV